MNRSREDEPYDIANINRALDELGMLSSVTESRREYQQECLRDGMEKLNVDQPGPSGSRWEPMKSPRSPGTQIEKENAVITGFQVLTMNSTFITSFRAGYELPCPSMREPGAAKHKCSLSRRRRLRTHPYDNAVPSTSDVVASAGSSSYRLRTTSLSSGTGKGRGGAGKNSNPSSSSSSGHTLVRSRSMENLTASISDGIVVTPKPRELDSVSRGIQQLRMDDCL